MRTLYPLTSVRTPETNKTAGRRGDRPDPAWHELNAMFAAQPSPPTYRVADLGDVPEPVRRYFGATIEDGAPVAVGDELPMRGQIKIGWWLPFRAWQLLAPRLGTVWAVRVAGVISGSDRYLQGTGGMDWKMLGLAPLVHADGPDVSRSAAERAAGESIWVPTALLPGRGATWTAASDSEITVRLDTDGHSVTLHHEVDLAGRIRRSAFARWGDPDNTGIWAELPFGVEVTGYATFDGVTIPSVGRVGWYAGTDRWAAGEFFRYQITHYRQV